MKIIWSFSLKALVLIFEAWNEILVYKYLQSISKGILFVKNLVVPPGLTLKDISKVKKLGNNLFVPARNGKKHVFLIYHLGDLRDPTLASVLETAAEDENDSSDLSLLSVDEAGSKCLIINKNNNNSKATLYSSDTKFRVRRENNSKDDSNEKDDARADPPTLEFFVETGLNNSVMKITRSLKLSDGNETRKLFIPEEMKFKIKATDLKKTKDFFVMEIKNFLPSGVKDIKILRSSLADIKFRDCLALISKDEFAVHSKPGSLKFVPSFDNKRLPRLRSSNFLYTIDELPIISPLLRINSSCENIWWVSNSSDYIIFCRSLHQASEASLHFLNESKSLGKAIEFVAKGDSNFFTFTGKLSTMLDVYSIELVSKRGERNEIKFIKSIELDILIAKEVCAIKSLEGRTTEVLICLATNKTESEGFWVLLIEHLKGNIQERKFFMGSVNIERNSTEMEQAKSSLIIDEVSCNDKMQLSFKYALSSRRQMLQGTVRMRLFENQLVSTAEEEEEANTPKIEYSAIQDFPDRCTVRKILKEKKLFFTQCDFPDSGQNTILMLEEETLEIRASLPLQGDSEESYPFELLNIDSAVIDKAFFNRSYEDFLVYKDINLIEVLTQTSLILLSYGKPDELYIPRHQLDKDSVDFSIDLRIKTLYDENNVVLKFNFEDHSPRLGVYEKSWIWLTLAIIAIINALAVTAYAIYMKVKQKRYLNQMILEENSSSEIRTV